MSVSVDEALLLIEKSVFKDDFEIIPIEYATKRVIYQDIITTVAMPPFNNSAMDGYGIKLEQAGSNVVIKDTIFAGDDKEVILDKNEVIKIMTGAKVPNNIEAIVPFEDAIKEDSFVSIPKDVKQNQHIRFIGEDIQKDTLLIKSGKELNFADIMLLSSQGISHIKVYTKPKVALFTSGDELRLHFEKKESHQIYNSNLPSLMARLNELGCEVHFIDIVKDDISCIKNMFKKALKYDLIITTGGISKGEADFIKSVLDEFEYENIFDGIAIKPGKPTNFGKIKDTFILNLPGNPLAANLIFELFGRMIIQKLKGSNNLFHSYILAKIKDNFNLKGNRDSIIVGNFDGEYFEVEPNSAPGRVGVLYKNNSFLLVSKGVKEIKKGNFVKVIPINFNFFNDTKKDIWVR